MRNHTTDTPAPAESLVTPTLEHRVMRLESRNRWLSAALVAVGAVALLGSAASRADEVVSARRIEMVDDEGRVRAELAIDADGSAGLFLRDEQGRVRGCTIHDETQSGTFALDEDGQIRMGAALFAHGGSGFALHGPGGKGSAVLYLKGKGSLTFYRPDGTEKRIEE
jgi:flavin-dependent dehydrogenase